MSVPNIAFCASAGLKHEEIMFHRQNCTSNFGCPVCNISNAIADINGARGWLRLMLPKLEDEFSVKLIIISLEVILPELRLNQRREFERWKAALWKSRLGGTQ